MKGNKGIVFAVGGDSRGKITSGTKKFAGGGEAS